MKNESNELFEIGVGVVLGYLYGWWCLPAVFLWAYLKSK